MKSQNIDSITYIYNIQDLINFRDSVNAGNNYAGKIVYLMEDIDMSTVCSDTLGSWEPIGTKELPFKGTFNGKYHKINNLYINSTEDYQALFGKASSGTIRNVTINNAKITGAEYVAGLLAYGEDITIDSIGISKDSNNENASINATINCAGGIVGYGTNITISESYNQLDVTTDNPKKPMVQSAGIIGIGRDSTSISHCYNAGDITTIGYPSSYTPQGVRAGGIIGDGIGNSKNYLIIEYCYNLGEITSNGYITEAGGISGFTERTILDHCFNVGNTKGLNTVGNRVGNLSGMAYNSQINNCYYIKNNMCGFNYSGNSFSNNKLETVDNIKNISMDILGTYYWIEDNGKNEGYPLLWWQGSFIELDATQEYIKIGQNRKINLTQHVGEGLTLPEDNKFTWTSSNTNVAIVDSNGVVTGIGVGSTTITVYDSNGQKAKAIINVYRNQQGAVTVPQVESGEGFTVVLKEDGTVWSTGENDVGQLGDGTTTNRNVLEQVKIDENTYLTNIKKIAVGYNQAVALGLDGQVYAWGLNSGGYDGVLGQGDTGNKLYAVKLKGAKGEGYLENIIDIACGEGTTYAINIDGTAFGCGDNTFHEIDSTNNSKMLYPTQVNKMKNIVKITAGCNIVSTISSNRGVLVKGHNLYGAFGNGLTANDGGLYVVGTDINEIEVCGYIGAILKEDGSLWTTGDNRCGQLGLGDTENRNVYTQIKYQNGDFVKAKTISASSRNLQFMGEDGKVYVTGYNGNGQLSNGGTGNSTYPTVMKNSDGTEVTDSLLLMSGGICNWKNNSLNLGLIRKDGSIWLSGDNTYGQIGNETTTSTNYLTPMVKTNEISMNKRNEYIKIGDTLDLDAQGGTYNINVFVDEIEENTNQQDWNRWTSSNEEVAVVDENGIVVGKGIGHTTITAYNTNGLKAKAIINVYRNEQGAVTVPQVVIGEGVTVVLKEDGSVWATGGNSVGELADGTNTNRNNLQQVKIDENTYLTKVKKIAIGQAQIVALTLDGEAYGWGYNQYGKLGQGDETNRAYATKVKGVNGQGYLSNIIDIACGDINTYLLSDKGIIYGIGSNCWYQIDDKDRGNRLYPSEVAKIENAINVTSGYSNMGAILANGDTWIKGHNLYGAFGNGVAVENGGQYLIGTDINEFELGGYFGAILREDGDLWASGRNEYGQLGLGDTSNKTNYTRVKYQDGNFVKAKTIARGSKNLQFIGEDGKVYVTGYNGNGQLSNGGTENSTYPTVMKNADGTEVTDVLLSVQEGLCYYQRNPINMGIIRKDGSIWISGDNTYGQIGNGTNTSTNYLTPMAIMNEVSMNKRNEYIKIGDTLDLDVLGGTYNVNVFVDETEENTNQRDWYRWTSSNEEVAVVDENGIVVGKGIGHTTITAYNTNGLKAKAIINVYRNVEGAITVPQVAIGEGYTVVLKEDGTVWTSGVNDGGQLGDGTGANRNTLTQVKIDENTYLTNIRKIVTDNAGGAKALTIDGEVYGWGWNSCGQLGQGDNKNRLYATKIKGINGEGYLENIIDIASGDATTYALDNRGNIIGAGHNETNAINDTNNGFIYYSTEVTGIKNAIKIVSSSPKLLAISANGESWVKGHNLYGEFGNGQTVKKGGLYLIGTDINEIEAGEYFASILKEDGSIWTTGRNEQGQLGLGDTGNRSVYTQVKYENGDIVKAKTISAGSQNIQFIGEDGKVYVTGYNGNGQLSNGGTGNSTYPTVMKNADGTEVTDSLLLAIGGFCSWNVNSRNMGLIRKDGSIWLSGDNIYGQIGNGTNTGTNYLTPMKHIYMPSLEKIEMQVGETRTLTEEELTCTKELVNVFGKGETEDFVIENLEILDTNIAVCQNKTIEAVTVGNTELKLQDETGIEIKVPVIVVSDDATIELVEVNDIVRKPTVADDHIYEVGIPKLAETAKIRVKAISKYAKVQIAENEASRGETTVTVNIDLSEDRITIPVKVTASDGVTEENYSIILIRKSNEVGINSVVVNEKEIQNVNDVYKYYLKDGENTAHVEITALENSNATIEVEEHKGIEFVEFDENVTSGTIKIEKKIKVTSEDGTVTKEYTLIISIKTQITGKITTENYMGKNIATVKLYRRRKREDEEYSDEELITEIETNEDGSYVLDIDEIGVYDVLVTKPGYLSYKVAEIEIKTGAIVELQEYALIAGDVVEDGEIEIDDLVAINDNYGVTITDDNRLTKSIYDLDEDGKIDRQDRNILKKNYGKKAEEVKWVNPNAEITTFALEKDVTNISTNNTINNTPDVVEDSINRPQISEGMLINTEKEFILPMACKYKITSDYGTRTHPITGEIKTHHGIDLSGVHHTEILSVADGIVTFAGVQNVYGNCIEIKHTVNGKVIYSFYAHLSKINIKVGEKVKKGQVIGLEGGASTDDNPGTSTGHHLHFELRTGSGSGHSIDPRDYINF